METPPTNDVVPARILTVDFSKAQDLRQHATGRFQDTLPKKIGADGRVLTPKQIRSRARRKMKRNEYMSDQEMEYLFRKPVEDWDLEELAHGRPRNSKGHFTGPNPKFVTAEMHERAMEKYTAAVKTGMRVATVDALGLLKELITSEATDDRGKPLVAASTKLDAAKFLLEHVVGKPTQRIESDVSVKLQGILGQVMVNPTEVMGGQAAPQYTVAHYPGITMALTNDDDLLEEDSGES
jgi:hypothetical protein